MLITPLDDDDVVSPIADHVPAFIVVLAFVLELDLVTWSLGAVDTDVHDVCAWKEDKIGMSKVSMQPKIFLSRSHNAV